MYRKRIAVDLAKDVFQVAEAERNSVVSARKRLSRMAFVRYIQAQTEPSLFIMEACGTAHYWARFVQTLGHHCVLLHARYVKPYRQRNNLLRSILREFGIEAPCSVEQFLKQAPLLMDNALLQPIAPQLYLLLADITHFGLAMQECEARLTRLLQHDTIAERLDEVSGIGILTASAFMVAVNQPERFKNGRVLSAWLGMTPRENSSGARRQLGSISRQGNTYVRMLLTHGARSALLAAKRCATRTPEKLTALQRWAVQCADRIGFNKATVALANKMVRICWAVWCHERRFNGNFALTIKAR